MTVRYVIASVQRSGSTLLAKALEQAGFGAPDEFFRVTDSKPRTARFQDWTDSERNGYAGVKIHQYQWQHHDLSSEIPRCFPEARYIYLTRRNTVRQAVSLVRARQTGQWTSRDTARAEPRFDAEAIRAAILETAAEESGWEDVFQSCRIKPLRIDYEELCSNYRMTLNAVGASLGAPWTDFEWPPFERLADAVNEDWVHRMRAYGFRL